MRTKILLALLLACGTAQAAHAAPGCDADAAYSIAQKITDEARSLTLQMITENDAIATDNVARTTMNITTCHLVPRADVDQLGTCLSSYKGDARDVSFRLMLGKVHASLAMNAYKCRGAADYNVGIFQIMEDRGGANDERVVTRLKNWQAVKEFEESERAAHIATAEHILQPLADVDNPDALQALGILGISPELSGNSLDQNVAKDYLYRAGLTYLKMNERSNALQMVSILEEHDKDDQLASRLREKIYAEK